VALGSTPMRERSRLAHHAMKRSEDGKPAVTRHAGGHAMATWMSRVLGLLVACSVLAVAAATTTTGSAQASHADYAAAYAVGLEAYSYGLPLVATDKTFRNMTSINVSRGAYGPVNQFHHVRALNDPKSKAVVAPGSNGLSSIAWLDLRREPQVLHVPLVHNHFFVLALEDPYTEDIRNLGTVHATKPGYYVIAGPGQHAVPIPAGLHRIDVDYSRIWIIGSTQLKGQKDVAAVNRIQDGFTLIPLSKYGTDYRPARPAHPDTTIDTAPLPAGLQFFDTLGKLLRQFPPPAADQAELSRFAAVGIGPGLTPSQNATLDPETLRGLADAAATGPTRIHDDATALFLAGFAAHAGYFLGGFGHYGTDYRLRGVVAEIGLGAVSSDQTIFALTQTDHSLRPLSGSASYVLHMPVAPPVDEGWSLTVYDTHGFLVPNPIDRYEVASQLPLARNADGSVDVYLQSTAPADPARALNWLPTPSGAGFELIWRLIGPKPTAIAGILDGSGWEPPSLTAVPSAGPTP
jgi:hypothetical protein